MQASHSSSASPTAPPDREATQWAAAFRRCLGHFATGVTVVTTEIDGQSFGVTANSFSSVSLEPPLVLWSIGRTSRSFEAFQRADKFAINILSQEQLEFCRNFSNRGADKFANGKWSSGRLGLPILDGVVAYLECSCYSRHDGGDHIIMIGKVQHFVYTQGDPLVFLHGDYRSTGHVLTALSAPGTRSAAASAV